MVPGALADPDERLRSLGRFVAGALFSDLADATVSALKLDVLDTIGCALKGLSHPFMATVRDQVADFGGVPRCTVIGGTQTSPAYAAWHNAAAVGCGDLAEPSRAVPHPGDSLAAVLAAVEYRDGGGEELLASLAVAYQVASALVREPAEGARANQWSVLACSLAAGIARALDLEAPRVESAVALSAAGEGTGRADDSGPGTPWDRLSAANVSLLATNGAYLAMRGAVEFPATVAPPVIARVDWGRQQLDAVRDFATSRAGREAEAAPTETQVLERFDRQAADTADRGLREAIVDAVLRLEAIEISELMALLGRAQVPQTAAMLRDAERAREDASRGWDDVVDKSFPASDPPPTG